MNRKPEKISGLIGGILAVILMCITMFLVFQITADPSAYDDIGIHFNQDDITSMYLLYIPACLASIISVVAALRVEKNTKISGIVLIVCAIVLIFSNIINIVSFVLLMISGVMCLARTPKSSLASE